MTTPQALSGQLAAEIKGAAKALKISQRELSDSAGIPLTTLNQKLKGLRPFNTLELAAISGVLGLSLTELALRAERALAKEAA